MMLKQLAWLAVALGVETAQAAPPVAEVQDVPSVHHGTVVKDPYRWMEDVNSAKAQAWMGAQGEATRALLDRIDQRSQIEARVAELSRASGDVVRSVRQMPRGHLFYLKRPAGENQFKLYTRRGLAGAERVVVDPGLETRKTGVPHAINHYQPSWNSRYVAYGMSAGGSENATLFVIDLVTGKSVVEPLPRAQEGGVSWLPDSRSLLVNQLRERQAGDPETEMYMDSRVMWLKLSGGEPQPVFGPTVLPALQLDRLDVAELITAPGSRWMVARTTDTTVPEGKLFVAPVASLGRADSPWRQVGEPGDKIQDVALQGDRLFVMTRLNAPRRKVVVVDLVAGTLQGATEVVAEPKTGMIEWFMVTQRGLVVGHREGTAIKPRRHAPGDRMGTAIALPRAGASWPTTLAAADSDEPLVWFSGWAEPGGFLRLRGNQAQATSLVVPPRGSAMADVVVKDVEFASHDGVRVPMTLLHRRGLALDGQNPVLLSGYASYGFSMTAGYSAGRQAWLERGGVLAFVNARGSGVHGDEWHRAGFKATKRNTWLDGVAAARWLIAQGYGSPRTMGVMGTSAGGIFVGRAVTTAPELFAAAVFDVGVLDAIRAEVSANGITNISEFGTVKDPVEFKALLEMSTYHQIQDGTRYPGVMLVHGMNDPRVDVWHSAKTAARLQAANPGGPPALLRLDRKAGHGIGSTAGQSHAYQADIFAFMLWQMGKLGLKD